MPIKVNLPDTKKKLKELTDQLAEGGLTLEDAEERLRLAWPVAGDMLEAGLSEINAIVALPEGSIADAFNGHEKLRLWFGEIDHHSHARTVQNRMEGIARRHGKNVTVGVKPDEFDKDDDRKSPNGITGGILNVTKTRMRVYTNLIRKDIWDVAELLVHELGHLWFTDQKLEKETVYGKTKARDLAIYNPRKARRSTENYAIFCREIYEVSPQRHTQSRVYGAV